jgi:hypothetical protein
MDRVWVRLSLPRSLADLEGKQRIWREFAGAAAAKCGYAQRGGLIAGGGFPNCSLEKTMTFRMALLILLALPAGLFAQSDDFSRVGVEVEAGPFWQTRNDVRIPPEGGTEFSMLDVTGKGPKAYFRVYANVNLARRHSIRFLAAPLRNKGTGQFGEEVFFVDQAFEPGENTEGTYEFNTYRITYGYSFIDRPAWVLKIGGAALIRDAKIRLVQNGVQAEDTDLGVVPLVFFQARRNFTDRAYFVFDFEGLGSPQGRALDASAKFHYKLTDHLNVGVGYRTLEGGADVDSVFNFAWLHFAAASIGWEF